MYLRGRSRFVGFRADHRQHAARGIAGNDIRIDIEILQSPAGRPGTRRTGTSILARWCNPHPEKAIRSPS